MEVEGSSVEQGPSNANAKRGVLQSSPEVKVDDERMDEDAVPEAQANMEEFVVFANTRALFEQISGRMKCKHDDCGGSYQGRNIRVKGLGGTAQLYFECDRCCADEMISTGSMETRYPMPYNACVTPLLLLCGVQRC